MHAVRTCFSCPLALPSVSQLLSSLQALIQISPSLSHYFSPHLSSFKYLRLINNRAARVWTRVLLYGGTTREQGPSHKTARYLDRGPVSPTASSSRPAAVASSKYIIKYNIQIYIPLKNLLHVVIFFPLLKASEHSAKSCAPHPPD